jgi:Malectin domain
MKNKTRWICLVAMPLMLAPMLFAGCQSSKTSDPKKSVAPVAPAPGAAAPVAPMAAVAPVIAPAPAAPGEVLPPVHIKAGLSTTLTDADGVVWIAEQGFTGGDTIDRGDDMQIANTKSPALYRTEHYGMTAFSYPVPNGKYIVKLHFAETFDGITAAGERVFSFNVERKEFKDFDVFVKAGGPQRAYIETVPVNVTDGKLDITFTSNIENPEINGIEILPAP